MATPFLSEVRIFAFAFAPKGWAFCNGQTLPINQNQALFSLLGTTYGGDGQTNFKLPNLQSRMPFHTGPGFDLGQVAGEESVTLTVGQMPQHVHPVNAGNASADQSTASNNFWAIQGGNAFAGTSNSPMSLKAISNVGNGQPHNNMSPYLVLNFCIALTGVFPSRN